jgi:hypothetical protein
LNQGPHPSDDNARSSILRTTSIAKLKTILQRKQEQLSNLLAETLLMSA